MALSQIDNAIAQPILPQWTVGQYVEVLPRTWPGINRPGGVGRILNVHCNDSGDVISLDVKYVLGHGSDKNLDLEYVRPHGNEAMEPSNTCTGRRSQRAVPTATTKNKDQLQQQPTPVADTENKPKKNTDKKEKLILKSSKSKPVPPTANLISDTEHEAHRKGKKQQKNTNKRLNNDNDDTDAELSNKAKEMKIDDFNLLPVRPSNKKPAAQFRGIDKIKEKKVDNQIKKNKKLKLLEEHPLKKKATGKSSLKKSSQKDIPHEIILSFPSFSDKSVIGFSGMSPLSTNVYTCSDEEEQDVSTTTSDGDGCVEDKEELGRNQAFLKIKGQKKEDETKPVLGQNRNHNSSMMALPEAEKDVESPSPDGNAHLSEEPERRRTNLTLREVYDLEIGRARTDIKRIIGTDKRTEIGQQESNLCKFSIRNSEEEKAKSEKLNRFSALLSEILMSNDEGTVEETEIGDQIKRLVASNNDGTASFSEDEIKQFLEALSNSNKIFRSDGFIYNI